MTRYFVSFHWLAANGRDGFSNIELTAPHEVMHVDGPFGVRGMEDSIVRECAKTNQPIIKATILHFQQLDGSGIVIAPAGTEPKDG